MNRAWDLDDWMFDSHGNLDVHGRLATDRPVVAKFYGAYNVGQQYADRRVCLCRQRNADDDIRRDRPIRRK